MAKRLRMRHPLLVLVLLLGLLLQPQPAAAQIGGETSNQFTQPDRIDTGWQISQSIPETFELAAENETFRLFFERTTLAFKVQDKRSGYTWHSTLDERADGDRLNRTWTAFAESGISIDYLDEKAQSKRNSITNAPNTISVNPIDQGLEATVTFTDPSITLTVVLRLEEAGLAVEIPFAALRQDDPAFKLGEVYVYPFFGATRTDQVPGYMFIPDGSGSLIRFQPGTLATNMYYGRYYGPDLGMLAELPWDPFINRANNLSIPVYGMVHGYKQNAFLSIVENGAAYGELQVHPAGIITNFNFLYNTFVYNESYFQATNRAGAGVTTLQKQTNAFDIAIHYRFLTGEDGDYVGMARSYRQYLLERGELQQVTEPTGNIGVRLEFLGGEQERVLFWKRLIPMTTVSQMAEILRDLKISNPEVVYYGWQRLGASAMAPKSFRLEPGLGSTGELTDLIAQVAAEGGRFSLYFDPMAAMLDGSGFSTRSDLAMSITDVNLLGYNRGKLNHYFNFSTIDDYLTRFSRDVSAELQAGLALDTIGSTVYTDFKPQNFLNRQDAIRQYRDLLTRAGAAAAFYTPNDYVFRFMDAYYDMPLSNSGYIYTTDAVPFLQIVLAGYVPYYGPAMNFSSNSRLDLLRHIDYGEYPSFFLSSAVTGRILYTNSSWIYTSSIDQWAGEIQQTYRWLDGLLAPVKGQEITARDVLAPGVTATTYANGKRILVNYTIAPFSADGVTVNAQDAVLVEVQP